MKTMPGNYGASTLSCNGAVANDTKWFRFTWLVPGNVSNNAQGQVALVDLTWEAQNN